VSRKRLKRGDGGILKNGGAENRVGINLVQTDVVNNRKENP